MRRALGLAVLLGAAGAPAVAAQDPAPADSRCVLVIENVDRDGTRQVEGGGINYYAGGNVRLRCRDQNVHMASDSMAAYAGNRVEFIGRVRYRDSTVRMDAERGTYFRDGERWEARGRVVAENLETGSKLRGPSLDYLRAASGVRDTFEMYAVGRPNVLYISKDSAGTAAEPYDIDADRLRVRGNDQVWAGGKVTIDRSDFAARADSMRLDTGVRDDGTLIGAPVLKGFGTDTFTLTGRRIDFELDDRELTYVTALGNGRAVTADMDLVADTIALDVNQKKLEQTLAWGDSLRPVAKSDDYTIRGDSLAIDTPDERLRELRAFGKAWLETPADSLTKEPNWLTGDSVTAVFVPRDSADAKGAALRTMTARGDARAYQQVKDEQRPGRPSIHYARGEQITITMREARAGESQEVERVDIRGQVDGIQLEPEEDAAAAPPPTATPAPAAPVLPPLPADSAGGRP